jgi:AbrB family looped-hinge helix DNA binding protein
MPVGKHLLGLPKRHIFGTAKVGEKGQIVIPKEARKLFGIQPGDTLLLVGDEKNGIIITRPEVLNNIADQILDNLGAKENGKDEEE